MSIEQRTKETYVKVFGNWRVGEKIGGGSQGKTIVFKIYKTNSTFEEVGVIKIINIFDTYVENISDEMKRRLEHEITELKMSAENELCLMNKMKGHQNIVSYHEFQFETYQDGNHYGVDLLIRMDCYENVGQMIKEGHMLQENQVIKMGRDISQALVDCQENGIMHRDIKPDNIFVNNYGTYLLGDFGISKLTASQELVGSTQTGSYPYVAPEQIHAYGEGVYDGSVDIYGLGLTLYVLSNENRIPFARTTYKKPEDIQRRLAGAKLPAPSKAGNALSDIILKACEYKKENRFASAKEFHKALCALQMDSEQFIDQTVSVTNTAMQESDKDLDGTMPATMIQNKVMGDYSEDTVPAFETQQKEIHGDIDSTMPASKVMVDVPSDALDMTVPASKLMTGVSSDEIDMTIPVSKIVADVSREEIDMTVPTSKMQEAVEKEQNKIPEHANKAVEKRNISGVKTAEMKSSKVNASEAKASTSNAKPVQKKTKAPEQVKEPKENFFQRLGNKNGERDFNVGLELYESGDYGAAIGHLKKAASKGHTEGLLYLGYCYESGKGIEKDPKAAQECFEASAQKGNLTAKTVLNWKA